MLNHLKALFEARPNVWETSGKNKDRVFGGSSWMTFITLDQTQQEKKIILGRRGPGHSNPLRDWAKKC